MVNIQKTVDIQFKNKIYKLEIVASQDILFINLKNIQDEEEWVGRHSKEYIQELTRKTGNFKKFGVFVEMLLSTVENEGGPVMLDLLNSQDLKSLKGNVGSDKVYLVVTYAVAFDRVHYPIPLVKEKSKRVKDRDFLRAKNEELEIVREKMEEQALRMAKLIKENKKLKEEMENMEYSRIPVDTSRIKRQLDSEIRLIERNGGSSMILSSISRLKGLVQELYQNLGITRSRSASLNNSTSPARNISKEKYKVIKSRPLQNIKSLNTFREPKSTKSRDRNARSSSGSRERMPFKRFDPTEYIRSREQSLEKRRNVIGNHSRSNSLSELSRKSSSSLVNSRDNLPRSKSQKAAIRPRKEPTSLDFLKENNSIDQRLEEIHRILKSTLS